MRSLLKITAIAAFALHAAADDTAVANTSDIDVTDGSVEDSARGPVHIGGGGRIGGGGVHLGGAVRGGGVHLGGSVGVRPGGGVHLGGGVGVGNRGRPSSPRPISIGGRPGGGRPSSPRPVGNRPGGGGRPITIGGNRPGGGRPSSPRPVGNRPGGGGRPITIGGNRPGGGRPSSPRPGGGGRPITIGGNRPGGGRPIGPGGRPGNYGGGRPNPGGPRRPFPNPGSYHNGGGGVRGGNYPRPGGGPRHPGGPRPWSGNGPAPQGWDQPWHGGPRPWNGPGLAPAGWNDVWDWGPDWDNGFWGYGYAGPHYGLDGFLFNPIVIPIPTIGWSAPSSFVSYGSECDVNQPEQCETGMCCSGLDGYNLCLSDQDVESGDQCYVVQADQVPTQELPAQISIETIIPPAETSYIPVPQPAQTVIAPGPTTFVPGPTTYLTGPTTFLTATSTAYPYYPALTATIPPVYPVDNLPPPTATAIAAQGYPQITAPAYAPGDGSDGSDDSYPYDDAYNYPYKKKDVKVGK